MFGGDDGDDQGMGGGFQSMGMGGFPGMFAQQSGGARQARQPRPQKTVVVKKVPCSLEELFTGFVCSFFSLLSLIVDADSRRS